MSGVESPINVANLDMTVISKSEGWQKIAKEYKSNKLVKILYNDTEIEINPLVLLKYFRGMSLIIIDVAYALFLKEKGLTQEELVKQAFGSETPTSDYDFSLVGYGSSDLLEWILKSFKNSFPDKAFSNIYDSNGYLGPEIKIYPEGHRLYKKLPEWVVLNIIPSTLTIKSGMILPVSKAAIKVESKSVLKKYTETLSHTHDDVDSIEYYDNKYKELIKLGREMEAFVYKTDVESSIKSEEEYWELISKMLHTSVEAYVSVSTIIAIVNIIQAKQNSFINLLTKENWLISIFENIVDLIGHGGIQYVESTGEFGISDSTVHLIHTSKYTMRCLLCLKYLLATTKSVSGIGSLDYIGNIKDIDKMINITQAVVNLRGTSSLNSSTNDLIALYRKDVVSNIVNMIPRIKSIIETIQDDKPTSTLPPTVPVPSVGGNRKNKKGTRKIQRDAIQNKRYSLRR